MSEHTEWGNAEGVSDTVWALSGEKEVTGRPGLPAEDTEWSCCWCLRENSQQGRRLCSLSVCHWQRAAACVIDSFTNQSSCSSTKHQGSLPVYSLNRPKSTGLTGWLPELSLSLFHYPPPQINPPLLLYLCMHILFFQLPLFHPSLTTW